MDCLMRAPFLSSRDIKAPGGDLKAGGRLLLRVARLVAIALRGFPTYPWHILTQKSWCIPLIALSVFLLSRPYPGIVQDAYIYMGRALADLDPDGVGRDLMFVHDGQFGFSLFRYMSKAMVAMTGLASAAKTLAFVGVLLWFSAALFFARQFGIGGAVWAVMVFVALLPASYGAPYPFGFAEPLAIPRPFAEAFVLAALAALARARTRLSLGCLVVAGLLHPLMALPGAAILLAVLGIENKRWFVLYAWAVAVLVAGSALGLPLLDRLFVAPDPSLRSLYESRSPFLFPSRWPGESFAPLIVQAATIAIAAHFQQGRHRLILALIVAAGLGGVAVSAIFGDWLSSLLIIQLQPWRMTWLMSAVGPIAFGVCAIGLWPRGASGRIILALLALASTFNTELQIAAAAATLALYLYFNQNRYESLLKARFVPAVWLFTLGISVSWQLRLFGGPWQYFLDAPAGYGCLLLILVRCVLPLPLCLLAAYFAVAKPPAARRLQVSFALSLFAAVIFLWDQRTPGQRMIETGHPPAEIVQLIEGRKGEVLWIDGLAEAWYMLGRPQWATPLQGIPIIFSSALASEWRDRTQVLMNLRLAGQDSFTPWRERTGLPQLSQDGVRRLCARGDAPAWIIAPLEYGAGPPAGLQMALWQLPGPHFKLAKASGEYVWRQIDAYGVISCAGEARAQRFD
jgi:hypothetical protein